MSIIFFDWIATTFINVVKIQQFFKMLFSMNKYSVFNVMFVFFPFFFYVLFHSSSLDRTLTSILLQITNSFVINLLSALWSKSRWSISSWDCTNIQNWSWKIQWIGTGMDPKICYVMWCFLNKNYPSEE